MIDPRSFARALGGEAHGNRVLAPGPGHSKHDRSLSVLCQGGEFIVHSFAGDDPLVCRDYVRERAGLPAFRPGGDHGRANRRRLLSSSHVAEPNNAERTRWALRLWGEAHSTDSSAAAPLRRYLEIRCGALPDDVLHSNALRFHPACPYKVGGRTIRFPAMVALMRDIRTDELRAIHRTALLPDGSGKAELPDGSHPKKMLGPSEEAAIKLSPDDMVTTGLGLTEGIETALSVMLTGWRPVWALGSAGAIKSFPRLGGIEALTIFADNDANEAGWSAAEACGERLAGEGVEVRVLAPPEPGQDWNDRLEVRR